MNPARKRVPTDNETAVLIKSARRCALCLYLNADLSEKLGQVAHLDHDPANGAEDNLAWMCMPHHSQFDSRTSQHKNYTIREIKEMRRKLYQAVAEQQHVTAGRQPRSGGEADRQTLARLLDLMRESRSMDWLRERNFAGFSFDWNRLDGIERFVTAHKGPEHEFLDPALEKLRTEFYDRSDKLLSLLAMVTFPVGNGNRQAIPEWWELEQPERFHKTVKEVHKAAEMVCSSYDRLVRTGRRKVLS